MIVTSETVTLVSRLQMPILPSGQITSLWHAKTLGGFEKPFAVSAVTNKLFSGACVRAAFTDASVELVKPITVRGQAITILPVVASLTDEENGLVWEFPPYAAFAENVVKKGEAAVNAIISGKKELTHQERMQAGKNLAAMLKKLAGVTFATTYDQHNVNAVPPQVHYRYVEFLDSHGLIEPAGKGDAYLLRLSEIGKNVLTYLSANYGEEQRKVSPRHLQPVVA